MQSVVSIEKGSNIIPYDIVQQCRYYQGSKKKNITDVTIIIGNDQLLVMRFHQSQCNKNNHSKLPPPIDVQRELYCEISKKLKKGGFEAMRFGGSSGLWNGPTKSFYKFLNYEGSLPRKAYATKLLPLKRSFLAAYIKIDRDNAVKTGSRAVSYEYSLPVVGGSFQMPASLLTEKKYSFLLDFIEYRLFAALIIDNINSSNCIDDKVQAAAVSSEIEKMKKTDLSIKNIKVHDDLFKYRRQQRGARVSKLNLRTKFLIQHSTLHCKYTLVTHSVGMHLDTFGREDSTLLPIKRKNGDSITQKVPKYSLENKICFIDHCCNKGDPGRGGKGSTFVWALLDW